jgi:mycothiol synthase
MKSFLFQDESDIQSMQDLIARLPQKSTVIDFEETIQLDSVRARTRLWKNDGKLIGFAYVDDFNNLRFEVEPESRSAQLEDEIIAWGLDCMKKRNAETRQNDTLDASFLVENTWQIALLQRSGFAQENLCSLHYARTLNEPIPEHPLPPGFSLRCVKGENEVENLVALHRAAFGTENMTVEERLAIMRAPQYERELDMLAIAPNGELAAFCICGIEDENIGYTDPIGVHKNYQRLGLGKAMLSAGLQKLKQRGIERTELGTSSENVAMQQLATAMGFVVISESLWFSKKAR